MAQIVFLGLHTAIKFKYRSRNGGRIFMLGCGSVSLGEHCLVILRIVVPSSSGLSSRKKCILLGLLGHEEGSITIL